jgi:uncharacterized membrane protein
MDSITLEHAPDAEREERNERPRPGNGSGNGNGSRHNDSSHHINVGDTERWLSLAGGAALALYALKRRSPVAFALAAGGAALIGRGATGHSTAYQKLGVDTADPNATRPNVLAAVLPSRKLEAERAYTIMRPRHELYAFWQDFQNLPRFMEHLESVTIEGDGRSHWVTKAPVGKAIEWDAKVTEQVEDRIIAWRSLPGSMVENSGQVQFSDAPDGRGTTVRARMRYSAPGGKIGMEISRFFGEAAFQQLRDDLRRFKQLMEAGETPTTEGQSHGPRKEAKS